MKEEVRKGLRGFAWILFCVYLLLLCYFLFFSETMGRTGFSRSYHYNLVPFREIGRFVKHSRSLGLSAVMLNIVGNVLVFAPFGGFLPLLAHRFRRFWYMLLLSFEFSLCIELIQLVSKVGSFDVDDLLLNTIGGALGYMCFWIVDALRGRRLRGKEI